MSVQKKRSRRAASRALMVVAVSAGLLSLPSTPAAPLTGEARTRLGPSTGPPGTSRPLMTPRAGIPRSERRVRARLRQVRAASFASFPPGYLPWPMLNHDRHRNGLSPETGPDDPSVLGPPWPYDIGAPSMSSPAIDADGTAYMGNEEGALHAVGADGKNRWVFHAGGGLDSPAIGRHVEGASTIFAAATDGTVYALSPSGGVRWSVNPAGTSMRSSPVVADLQPNSPLYRLYLGDEGGTLWAIFETSSSAAMVGWQASLGAPIQTSPVLSPGLDVVYATARDSLYCFNAMTGGPFGSSPFTVGRRVTMTTPVVDPATGNVVFGTAGGDVVEVDPECHAPVWTTTLADPVVQPPALAPDGSLRVIAGDRLVALASDGTFLWDQSMPDRLGSAAPAVDAGGTTIVGSTGGWVSAVAANLLGSGDRLLWSVQVSQSGSAVGTPAIDFGGRIYVPDAGGILNVIDEVPAFQIAYHSDLRQPANMDVYSLRETYGVVDPSRNLRITKASSKQLQPTYSLDPHQMAWVTDEQGNRDVVLATGNGGGGRLASDPAWPPFTPVSNETDPAFTPINDRTGGSMLPNLGTYLAMTTDASGVSQIVFLDLAALRQGNPSTLSFTQWAVAQGVQPAITSLLESPPDTTQSQVAFSPDGRKVAWVHCDRVHNVGSVELLTLAGASSTLFGMGPPLPAVEGGPGGCLDDAPAFSPDSRWLLMRQTTGGDLGVYDVTAPTAGAMTIKTPAGFELLHPNWAPDGTEIAVGRRTSGLIDVDLDLLSGKQYAALTDITATHTSDEPFYRFGKMPPPQALRIRAGQPLNDTAQYPGQRIEILGQGFDILHPQENQVTFTDTLRGDPRPAQLISATVDPLEGLGVLTVVVPDFAGNGPIHVTTRFGTSDCCTFTVVPIPAAILQQHSVIGAKVRVFGLGFDLSPATNTVVEFSKETGGIVAGTVLSGFIDGTKEVLVVKVPVGTAQAGVIAAESVPGKLGKVCTAAPCAFSLLKPVLKVERLRNDTANQPANLPVGYRTQGCPGCHLRVTASAFPFDPFVGYGQSMSVRVATWNKNMPPQVGTSYPLVQTGPDTAGTPSGTQPGGVASLLPSRPTGTDPATGRSFDYEDDLTITATDDLLDPADPPVGTAHFKVPLLNIPIVFVPGTSGNSLDLAASKTPLIYAFPGDVHPEIFTTHAPHLWSDDPGLQDPRGPRIWVGPEMIESVLANSPGYGGNHYLDVLEFDQNGNPVHPEIAPGPSPDSVFRNITWPQVLAQLKGYEHGQPEYENLVHYLTGTKDDPNETVPNLTINSAFGVPVRPLCDVSWSSCTYNSGPPQSSPEFERGLYLFPYEFRGNMDDNEAALDAFVASILNLPRIKALGITKVDLITHSLGGPTARAFYLKHPNRVNQIISFGGGFGGVVKPVKILMMGDNWMDGTFNSVGPYGFAIQSWEVRKLARNWGTAYYQDPSFEGWFSDDGVPVPGNSKLVRERAYVWDDYPKTIGGDDTRFHTVSDSIDWIARNYNATLARKSQAFFGTFATPLADFSKGTGPVFHYRVIEEGVPTDLAARRYTVTVQSQGQTFLALFSQAIEGDGDNTIPLRGALGITPAGDDRVFIIGQKEVNWPLGTTNHEMKHADMTSPTESMNLVGQILTGAVCSQTQQLTFHSQNDIQVQEIFIDNTRPAPPPPPGPAMAPAQSSPVDRWLVRVDGGVQLDVTDSFGNHDGPFFHPDYKGLVERGIPDSDYGGELTTNDPGAPRSRFYVSAPGVYRFRLTGVYDSQTKLRLTAFNQRGVQETVLFPRVRMAKDAIGVFTFNTDRPLRTPVMRVTTPDGVTVSEPGVILDPATSADSVAPTTTATIDNGMAFVSATDDFSGVSETWVDAGHGPLPYEGPFTIPPDALMLQAYSMDRNGNVESPGTVIPALGLDRKLVRFRVQSGQTAEPRSVAVLNTDPLGVSGTIGWKAGEKVSWLDVSPTSGETPGSIAVTVDTTGLEPGTYVGRVTVTATTPGVLFPVRRLKVVLEVTAPAG